MLKQKRHLITGGAGLIGSHIADLLIQDGASEVVIIDDFSRGNRKNLHWASNHGKITIIEADIRDRRVLNKHIQGIDTVFHQAAIRITHCAENPGLAHQVLADGTLNVVEAAKNAGVRRIVAASSASIYGQAEEFPTSEKHHPYNNDTIYGAGKLYLEGLLKSYNAMFGLDYIALRYFNVYGPRMDTMGKYTEVLGLWIESIDKNQPPVILGDGSQTLDFIFVEDVARANIMAAKSKVSNFAVNVASGIETSLNDTACLLMEIMQKSLQIEYCPERKVNPVPRRLADTQKAWELIGFRAEIPFSEGLQRLVNWLRQERL